MTDADSLEKRRDKLASLQEKILAKRTAHPHDFGTRVWWAFVIFGALVGWLRSSTSMSILIHTAAFWVAGLFFCIFALDSAEVQSRVAIFLYKRSREKRVSAWLYERALTIRQEGTHH